MEQQAVPCSCRAAGGPSSQDGVGSAVEEEEAVANLMAAGQKMKCGASQRHATQDGLRESPTALSTGLVQLRREKAQCPTPASLEGVFGTTMLRVRFVPHDTTQNADSLASALSRTVQ